MGITLLPENSADAAAAKFGEAPPMGEKRRERWPEILAEKSAKKINEILAEILAENLEKCTFAFVYILIGPQGYFPTRWPPLAFIHASFQYNSLQNLSTPHKTKLLVK